MTPGRLERYRGICRVCGGEIIEDRRMFTGWKHATPLSGKPHDPRPTRNLDDALEMIEDIDRVRAVMRELRAAFARSDLDGGAKAAEQHPLYIQAAERLNEMHEAMMGLI